MGHLILGKFAREPLHYSTLPCVEFLARRAASAESHSDFVIGVKKREEEENKSSIAKGVNAEEEEVKDIRMLSILGYRMATIFKEASFLITLISTSDSVRVNSKSAESFPIRRFLMWRAGRNSGRCGFEKRISRSAP